MGATSPANLKWGAGELTAMRRAVNTLIRRTYDSYAASRSSPVRRIHRRFISSPLVVSALFGMKVAPQQRPGKAETRVGYFDLPLSC